MLQANEINETIETVADQMSNAEAFDQYFEQVHNIFDIYGVGHGCLHALHEPYSPAQALWRVTPDDVTNACSHLVKTRKHPALTLGVNHHFPFEFFEFRDQFEGDPEIEALYEAFENNDVLHAYGLPIQTLDRGTFVFVVARPGSPIDTVELLTLQAICSNAVNGVRQFVDSPSNTRKAKILSANQRQLLLDVASGSTVQDISKRENLGELTIKSQLDFIVSKLGGRNLSHAIILALIEAEIGLSEIKLKTP